MRYDVEAKGEIESLKKEMHEQKISTLKLVREALENPEKFQRDLKK